MTKTIDTGLVFESIGKAVAERSGFAPVNMSIDLATVPQETLLRLASQGAKIFVSRMFAADKDAKIKESDYADAIATMFEAWKNGTEWRAKGESKPKISGTNYKAKATKILAQLYAKSQKWDFKDVDKAKESWAFVQTNWADKVDLKAKQLEDDAAWEAELAASLSEGWTPEPEVTMPQEVNF
jgi:hypothetical protein